MTADIAREIRTLEDMTVDELKRRWAEVFSEEAPNSHPRYLLKRLAWRIQANAEGDISERARRRAEELANDADLRTKAPKRARDIMSDLTATGELPSSHDPRLPMPGTVLTREYKGRTVTCTVRVNGFEHEGEVYSSLTAVARAITGSHWNGYHFFGLRRDS